MVRVLERLRQEHGAPERIQVDNGPEFISRVVDQWEYQHGVALRFIRPGKSTDNGRIESFNDKFRDESLRQFWFVNLVEARERIEAWRIDYNQVLPHSGLGYQTPEEFAAKMAARIQRGAGLSGTSTPSDSLPRTTLLAACRVQPRTYLRSGKG